MDIAKSFTFVTEDERWLEKLGIGVGLVLVSSILAPILIGILGFFILIGYCVRLVQNVRDGVPKPLPEWNRWGDDMVSGLKLAVAMFIYALPIILFSVPMTVGAMLTDERSRGGAGLVGWPLMLCGICLVTLYGIVFTLFQPGITVAFARGESLRSALQLSDIWAWTRRNLSGVLVVTVVYIVASVVIGLAGAVVGVILCLVGLIVTIPLATLYTYLVQSHLYGQLARQDPDIVLPRSAPVTPSVAPVVPPDVEPVSPAATSTEPNVTPYAPSATASYTPGEPVEPVAPHTVPPTVPPAEASDLSADLPPAAKPDEDPNVPPAL